MSQPFKIRRRYALQLLGGATSAALLHACGSNSGDSVESSDSAPDAAGDAATKELTMSLTLGTVPWIGQVPIYIAMEKGFYADEGLDFSLNLFGSNGEYLSAFLSGQLEAISPVSSEAVLLRSQGKDYKIVLVQDNSVGGDGILTTGGINSIEDFKGQKVAVDTAGVSYFFLLQVLKEAGLTKDDITVINTDAAAAAAAFQSGNVDIAVTYAPYLQQAADAVEDGKIIYDSSSMPTAIIDLYLFDTAFVEENPETVQAFVNATLRGLEYLETNSEEALAISAAELEVTPEELAGDLEGVKLPDVDTNLKMLASPEDDLYLEEPMEDLATFLFAEGQIESEVSDFPALFDPQFVQAYKDQ
ncbi:MAG: ABC transporter substrate-binding protein [Cyanobacteria bacterium J06554_3]